ncbi:hypothetical protein E2C01_003594 [Portunus trituberculatus]|uniref:Uncharacterized protein n=1 Tax=Portunus trituberculatus TaxID=210409 RepID=A0A5B7CN66_PORTR|nr:hypothetical protein [Portunus trituberculatus]
MREISPLREGWRGDREWGGEWTVSVVGCWEAGGTGKGALPAQTRTVSDGVRGHVVQYYGSISVGVSGDVTHIEHAVSAVLSQNREPVTVTLVTGEIGVQALLKNSATALSHSLTKFQTNMAEKQQY